MVPLIIIIPALGSSGPAIYWTLGLAFLKAAVVLAALLVFGQRLLRPWFHLVATQKSSELFMLNVLLFTLGLAYITELAGLSMALGAFVAVCSFLKPNTAIRWQKISNHSVMCCLACFSSLSACCSIRPA
ncbi:MAG: cation:proton antiporter [Nitrosomonadales bacterium]